MESSYRPAYSTSGWTRFDCPRQISADRLRYPPLFNEFAAWRGARTNSFTMKNMLRYSMIAVAIGACLLLALPAIGQTAVYKAPRTADGKPNLNGIWEALNSANW